MKCYRYKTASPLLSSFRDSTDKAMIICHRQLTLEYPLPKTIWSRLENHVAIIKRRGQNYSNAYVLSLVIQFFMINRRLIFTIKYLFKNSERRQKFVVHKKWFQFFFCAVSNHNCRLESACSGARHRWSSYHWDLNFDCLPVVNFLSI
jgi:hypothetical protein